MIEKPNYELQAAVDHLSRLPEPTPDPRDAEVGRLQAEVADLKKRLAAALDALGKTSAKLGAENARLEREVERMRLTLQDIRDGYGPQHGSEWCRTKAALGLLTSMKARDDHEQEVSRRDG